MRTYIFKLQLIILTTLLLTSCGAGSPSGPVLIPTSIEYAGGDISADIAVQTGKSMTFIAKDANNEPVDASNVNIIYKKNDVTVSDGSCGSETKSGTKITITAAETLPNVKSECKAEFSFQESLLAEGIYLVSVNPELISAGRYNFTAPSLISSDNARNARFAVTDENTVFACFMTIHPGETFGASYEARVYAIRSVDAGTTWSEPLNVAAFGAWSNENPGIYCSIAAIDAKNFALGWTYTTWLFGPSRMSLDYYVVFGTINDDGSLQTGNTIKVNDIGEDIPTDPYGARTGIMNLALDTNNILHAFYVSDAVVDANTERSLYYTYCAPSSLVCSFAASTKVNITPDTDVSVLGNALPMVIAPDNGSGTTILYAAWLVGSPNGGFVYVGEINKTGNIVSVTPRIVQIDIAYGTYAQMQNIMIDRNGLVATYWSEEIWDFSPNPDVLLYSKIMLVAWNPATQSFDSPITIGDPLESTSIQFVNIANDTYNAYHVIWGYITLGTNNGISYAMGRYAGNSFTSDALMDAFDNFFNIYELTPVVTVLPISAVSDNAGRSYLIWSAIDAGENNSVYLLGSQIE